MRNGELISLVMQNGLNIETHSYLTEYVQLPQALHNEQVLYAMCLIKITHYINVSLAMYCGEKFSSSSL